MFAFDNPGDSARIFKIITEKDPFRLIIRGYAVIEEVLDQAIDDAFSDGTPGELKGLRLSGRLALARGLELITPEIGAAITALSKIRNRFAHGGGGDEITPEEARSMHPVVEPFLSEEFDLDDYSEGDQLRIAVGTIWQATQETVHHALEQREQAANELAEYRRSQALTPAELRAFLEGDEDGWQGH